MTSETERTNKFPYFFHFNTFLISCLQLSFFPHILFLMTPALFLLSSFPVSLPLSLFQRLHAGSFFLNNSSSHLSFPLPFPFRSFSPLPHLSTFCPSSFLSFPLHLTIFYTVLSFTSHSGPPFLPFSPLSSLLLSL